MTTAKTDSAITKPATTKVKTKAASVPELIDLLEAGVHFGHERSKRNPKMAPYIYLQRNRIAILDLEKTQALLTKAMAFARRLGEKPKAELLYVGTKRQARAIVQRHAESAHQPFVTKRWLGGTLTNFSTILKSIEKLDELKTRQGSAATENLTKKEKAVMQKEIERLDQVLEGLKNLRTLPAALFVVGSHDEQLAVREAKRVGLPVIGITDTNADPQLVDYPIPANDDAVRSLDLIVGTITTAFTSGRKSIPAKKPATKATPKK